MTHLVLSGLTKRYADLTVLDRVDLAVARGELVCLLGPSGCGKTTTLRLIAGFLEPTAGEIRVGERLLSKPGEATPPERRGMSMIFQSYALWPHMTIFDNVAYGVRLHGLAASKTEMQTIVETSLRKAGLWDEVKDRLNAPGMSLSGGQQQRLVIARAIAVNPEIILMDEPCSALDPIATAKVEELIDELKSNYCIIIVTHSMAQAARVSQQTAFFHLGKLIETGPTETVFTNPKNSRTQDYITGRFG